MNAETKKPTLILSVREFASPMKRRGHIDAFSGFDWGHAQSGTEIHSVIAARHVRQVVGFQKEVSLSGEFFADPYYVMIRGRVDGLFETEVAEGEHRTKEILLEEIKSTSSISRLKEALTLYSEHPYRLQVQIYGYLYFLTHGIWPKTRLRLVSSLDRSEEEYEITFDKDNFEAWLARKLKGLVQQHDQHQALLRWRAQYGMSMKFPYHEMRHGQRELMESAAGVFNQGKQALIQAPTGLGKTIGIMFPALQDALRRGKQLFYVTPKNSQHWLAEKALLDLNTANPPDKNQCGSGAELRSVTITAKKKICMKDEPLCTPEHCEFAKDYHDKVSDYDLLDKLKTEKHLHMETFRQYARDYQVCPFELSLEAARETEVIICDYNYVFSPRSALEYLLVDDEGLALKQNLVIDECHQLFQRGCDYFSPEISQRFYQELAAGKERVPKHLRRRFKKILKEIIQAIADHAPKSPLPRVLIKLEAEFFMGLLLETQKLAFDYFKDLEKLEANDPILTLQNSLADFCEGLSRNAASFFVTYRRFSSGDSIKITCCEASDHLSQKLSVFNGVVGFSATLKPFSYYAKLSGFSETASMFFEFSSPFPKEHRKILVIPQVSTKLKNRHKSAPQIGEAVKRITRVRPGNYFVFFPSYDFLEQAVNHLLPDGFEVIKQTPYMSRAEAQNIIDTLCHAQDDKNYLVLAVQGGIFAEGIDYPGDALIGAIIVGPGLPQFDLEREELKNYYEKRYGAQQGYAYAYIYPAMTKVIQAAGRVIRTEEDRGIIVLLDERFCDPQYASLMPSGWYNESVRELVSTKIIADVSDFWSRAEATHAT